MAGSEDKYYPAISDRTWAVPPTRLAGKMRLFLELPASTEYQYRVRVLNWSSAPGWELVTITTNTGDNKWPEPMD